MGFTSITALYIYGRNTGKEVFNAGNKACGEYISYRKVGDHGTNMPATVWFANGTDIKENLRYKYDSYGNIAQITRNGDKIVSYEYDSLNRLARENNKPLNKTVVFSYDTNGNILSRCEYAYTVKSGEELSELTCKHFDYIYEGDRLIKILSSDGEEQFAYNNLGSPTTYRNTQLQWQYGRLLTKYGETTFEYDGAGRRTKKGDISYLYDSEGKLQYSSDGVQYLYDDKGVVGLVEDGGVGIMLYRKDAQGNIIAMLDSDGAVVVRYEYDAWGNHVVLDKDGNVINDPEHIGHKNPFRYRGYFFDEETGLYYLQTRYYDPAIGRFISQDGIDYADPQTPNGINLYAYCANNPVMNVDPSGTDLKGVWSSVKNWFKGVGNAIRDFFVENVYVGVHQPVYNGVTGAAVPDLQNLFGLPWKENPISFKNDTFLYDKLNNVINFLVQTSQTFFEEVLPDFLINTVWKDWIVGTVWEFLAHTKAGQIFLSSLGLVASIAGLVVSVIGCTTPIAPIAVAGIAVSAIGVLISTVSLFVSIFS